MIKVERIETWGFEHAIRGARNPMNSWDRSDSCYCVEREFDSCSECTYYDEIADGIDEICKYIAENPYVIGKNDLALMRKLYKAGSEHRKYMRQIFISMDITAPLYWWKEFDTYKIGTTADSCSTMHKIHEKEFTLDDFSCEHLKDCECVSEDEFYEFSCGRRYTPMDHLMDTIRILNKWRWIYLNKGKTKGAWWQMIQILPTSYNQKRTVTMNYENAVSMIRQREHHKLTEWVDFVKILKELPYMKEITAND